MELPSQVRGKYEEMRLAMPLGLVAKFFAAFLVLLGTSGLGLATMLCGTPHCPKTQVARPMPMAAKESCCAKKQTKPKSESGKRCCCEVKSAPKAAKLEAKLVIPAGLQVDLVLREPSLTVPEFVSVEPQAPISSVTDASPPDPARNPDRGRAPPAA